ncbi:MAG: hypothetical protein CSB49_01545 [Proteobacteria bacterium]|nr:MAG: hypothetical protein CSB49_01545 [Pseudomonadota bacterium]
MTKRANNKPIVVDVPQLMAASNGGRAGRGSRVLRFVGQLISIASVLPPGEPHQSQIGCRRRPARRACPGKLVIRRRELEDDILWQCPTCNDSGLVVSWQDSCWDREPALKSGELVSLLQVRAERDGRGGRRGLPLRQPARAYELSVELIGGPLDLEEAVIRRVRIGGDRTLHDLHLLILHAFDREEEEPYEFMFGAPYEPDARRFAGGLVVTGDEHDESWETQNLPLDSLEFGEGQVFGYLFDFGEEWVHRVTVVSISEERSYAIPPRVVERVGSSPPQYPDIDELWENDLLWDEVQDGFPVSGLFDPYNADEAQDADTWLAMEDLERLMVIIDAHGQDMPESHPSVESRLLHAVVHVLAETKLAEDRKAQSWVESRTRGGIGRHQAIHELGEQLVQEQLHEPPRVARGKKKPASGKTKRNNLHP